MIRRHGFFFWSAIVLTVVALALVAYFYGSADYGSVDTVEINRVKTELERGNHPENGRYDYVAVSPDGAVIAASAETAARTLTERLNDAVRDGDACVDFAGGKIIFFTGFETRLSSARDASLGTILSLTAFCFLLFLFEFFYLDRRVIAPFRKLEGFSAEVAKGNFDAPLRMDRANNFGAFTEAFDLMRQNLKDAEREKEEALESKRALLAEIGHDIRTPLASILAAAELSAAHGVRGMETIVEKANRIDALLTDIYDASLDEVGQLRVDPQPHRAGEIRDAVLSADFTGSVRFLNEPPGVVVLYDDARFKECVDNVLFNARKYAPGDVEVDFGIQNGMFRISFRDYGDGVDPEELAFVTDRFYRGRAARNKTGAGLGLYIAKTLLTKMDGAMEAENADGFRVTFFLKTV